MRGGTVNDIKQWRFLVTDWDDNTTYIGADGDETESEFSGTGREAIAEGERRANLWEARTGNLAAAIMRESRGLTHNVGLGITLKEKKCLEYLEI
jgi:hypothetical protein